MKGECEICGEKVETWHTAAFPVTGWELERGGGGGANQIKERKRVPDRIAHAACLEQRVNRQKHGVIEGQMGF